jgi:dTDP-4-amino-4,6-dideoxygalactose transaminase
MISFNKPFFTGNEILYIQQAIKSGHIAGNGIFTQNCQKYFEQKYHFGKSVLTTSCTDALEMASILCNIQTGDEVIIPSYTFVSSALPFVRQGAKLVFADSQADHPNMDAEKIEQLITPGPKQL